MSFPPGLQWRNIAEKNAMHYSQLYKAANRGEFSLLFISEKGERIKIQSCVCTSWFSDGHTMNIKLLESGQVRKIRRCTIIEFNGKEVYL